MNELKKILSDAFTEYQQTYRIGEGQPTQPILYPRNEFPDVVSYMAFKVQEHYSEFNFEEHE